MSVEKKDIEELEKDLGELKPKEEVEVESEDDHDYDDQTADYDAPEEEPDAEEEGAEKVEEQEPKKLANREKRKLQKQRRKERERQDRLMIEQLKAQNADLVQRFSQIENSHLSVQYEGIEKDINKGIRALETAQAAMQKAEADGDTMTWTKANALKQQAQQYVKDRTDLKDKMVENYQTRQNGAMKTSPQVKLYADKWQKINSDWCDLTDPVMKQAVLAIDAQVAQDGFDPATAAYWKELENRSRRVFNKPRPQKAKTVVNGSSPSGSMRDEAGGLDKEFVRVLKEQGIWDKPDMKKRAIEQYRIQKSKSKSS